MSHSKPFHRNYRDFIGRSNSGGYIIDRDYADSPEHYTRAFLLIQSDLLKIFEFVEPSDCNLDTYSFRIHELLTRTCIEIEANFKAILKENIYNPTDKKGTPISENRWNMQHYKKVNHTHHLSSYKVYVPIWDGERSVFEPFKQWATCSELFWYQAYNKSKHDRKQEFKKANFENLLNSVAGLLVLLSSQFVTETFTTGAQVLEMTGGSYYATKPALGNFFHIEFPSDWDEEEKYDFNWTDLIDQPDRFAKINYDKIK